MPFLLGLCGGRGVGKDTAFGFIQQWAEGRGLTACRRSFADKLKHSAALALGFRVEEPDAVVLMDELKNLGEITTVIPDQSILYTIDGRKFLQLYGTEAHREVFGQNFWVDALLPVLYDDNGSHDDSGWHAEFAFADICVTADVRFVNEAERIHELGGQIWEILRDTGTSDDHVSEAGLPDDQIDLKIPNFSSLDCFELELHHAMTEHAKRGGS